MPKRKKNLTAKQKLFVFHYCESGIGRYAAIAAGFSERSADVQASRLLSKVHVHKAIMRRLYRRKKMLNDRYACLFLSQKRFYHNARVNAAAYVLDKWISKA
jgi:phage terminase small subunit